MYPNSDWLPAAFSESADANDARMTYVPKDHALKVVRLLIPLLPLRRKNKNKTANRVRAASELAKLARLWMRRRAQIKQVGQHANKERVQNYDGTGKEYSARKEMLILFNSQLG